MFPVIGPVATTNDVTYVTPSYVVDHSPSVGQARHFRSWPRGWIGPVATTNDVTYVTPSYVVDHSPSVGQARHFRSWPRGWINGIGPVAIFNVSGPSYEIVYMPELGHLLCVCDYRVSQFTTADEFTDTTLRVITIEQNQYGNYSCRATNKLGSF